MLTVTGAEALYADMGHFGRPPIRRAWFLVVFPALILNYMGQGALILAHAERDREPVLPAVPATGAGSRWCVLATVATVIASQAVISGAFSVTRQAVQLGFLPRLTIRHTSREAGQVYVPAVNWGSSSRSSRSWSASAPRRTSPSAYGIAVTGTLAIDTLLFFVVVRVLWKKPLWVAIAGAGVLPARRPRLLRGQPARRSLHGGWFPLAIAARRVHRADDVAARPRDRHARSARSRGPAGATSSRSSATPTSRSRARPRTGVFLDANPETTPLALRANVEHNRVLHESVVIVVGRDAQRPARRRAERVTVDDLGYRDDGITHVTARFGFQDDLDVPATLRAAAERLEREVDFDSASYFLSRITIVATDAPGMARWRKKLFIAIARNAASPVDYFQLPDERTMVMASHVEL